MRYYILLLIILFISGCDVANLSEKDANNISKLKARIVIYDGDETHSLDQIKVSLSNGKKQVINEKIRVLVNNQPLELYVKEELYYTKTSFYRTDSLLRKDSYYFEIILPDSTKYPLAFIKPENRKENAYFNIPEIFHKNEDLLISWTNLNTPYVLNIIKGIRVKKKPAKNITEHGYDGRMIDTLHVREGKYIIPKSYFEDSLNVAEHLEVKLNRTEYGLVNPKLFANSSIAYSYNTLKVIDLEE